MLIGVITTIQEPTPSVSRLCDALTAVGAELIVAGDKKGPRTFAVPGARLLTIEDQIASGFRLGRELPTGHYARKNVAYLVAMWRNPECIYETDDDNAPNDNWRPRERRTTACVCSPKRWANVYRMFSEELIWPRGFPLERITDPGTYARDESESKQGVDALIQQGLVNGSPDVDAVWRLILDRPFWFDRSPSLYLPRGTWCPFNSQTTWWWRPAFPLLYLPSYCSFRMTDIWRSFVAQRCLWEVGSGVVFHAPEVDQDRNPHNLMRDFEDEIPGYLHNQRIVDVLEDIPLMPGPDAVTANLRRCYEEMVRISVIPSEELGLVDAWIDDLRSIQVNLA
jgi:hypothetical protein